MPLHDETRTFVILLLNHVICSNSSTVWTHVVINVTLWWWDCEILEPSASFTESLMFVHDKWGLVSVYFLQNNLKCLTDQDTLIRESYTADHICSDEAVPSSAL